MEPLNRRRNMIEEKENEPKRSEEIKRDRTRIMGSKRKKKYKVHQRRIRRAKFEELLQGDGSPPCLV